MTDGKTTPSDFMAGVALAMDFLRRAERLVGTDTEHACAEFRDGKPQAQLLPGLVATLTARPELMEGANAILIEAITSCSPGGPGPISLDAYERKGYRDFTCEVVHD